MLNLRNLITLRLSCVLILLLHEQYGVKVQSKRKDCSYMAKFNQGLLVSSHCLIGKTLLRGNISSRVHTHSGKQF